MRSPTGRCDPTRGSSWVQQASITTSTSDHSQGLSGLAPEGWGLQQLSQVMLTARATPPPPEHVQMRHIF
jgi:hypothetical protein